MLTNLLRPWLLARFLSGAAVAALCMVAVVVAVRVVRRWRDRESSEDQLALERQAELLATLVQASLAMAVFGLALTVLSADRMAESIRGAMCGYGVLDSTDYGFASLGTSALAAAACALWLVLHRLDLALTRPLLTRRKFAVLLFVAPLVWLDFYATTAHALTLDLGVAATCCSSSIDLSGRAVTGAAGDGARELVFYGALGAMAAACVAALWARRRPGAVAGWSAALLSLVAFVAALPAVVWYVAPHAYETPHHLCPFCLLHGDTYGIGYPLFAALFGAVVLGAAMGVLELHRTVAPDAVDALETRIGRLCAVAWGLAFLLAAGPVIRYALLTGGASLFGAS